MLTKAQQKGMHSSKSYEWYTPPDLLKEIAAFLGDYYDPCPEYRGRDQINNGLAPIWQGSVYVNPPYGRGVEKWIRKFTLDPVDEIILLVPARTETAWFAPLYDHTICFIRGRLKFSGSKDNAPFPSALVYRGPRPDEFASTFAHRGAIVQRLAVEAASLQPLLLVA